MLPVLHRPSFERDILLARHRRDIDFARLVLVVCAVGARFYDDERVYLRDENGKLEYPSAGWCYFAQTMSRPRLSVCSLLAAFTKVHL